MDRRYGLLTRARCLLLVLTPCGQCLLRTVYWANVSATLYLHTVGQFEFKLDGKLWLPHRGHTDCFDWRASLASVFHDVPIDCAARTLVGIRLKHAQDDVKLRCWCLVPGAQVFTDIICPSSNERHMSFMSMPQAYNCHPASIWLTYISVQQSAVLWTE